MGDLIYLNPEDSEDCISYSDRSNPELLKATNELSAFLNTLPLTNTQHNKLAKLIIKQLLAAELGSWNLGLNFGLHLDVKEKA